MEEKKQKSLTVNLIANGIKTLMSIIFPLITFPYASRVLGANGIGKVDYATSINSYFAMFASLGISTYAVREGARIHGDKQKFNKFAKEMLTINLITTIITYIVYGLFLALPILRGYKSLLVILSAGILFTTIAMEWLFIIEEEYVYITKRAILFQFISLILLFILVRSKKNYLQYAALTVISSGGSAILNFWHSRKFVDWTQKYKLDLKKHLVPIFLIFGTTVASTIYVKMDTTMLGIICGDTETGIYSAAVKLNDVITTMVAAISATVLPRISNYLGNNKKLDYEILLKNSSNFTFMLLIPAAIGMICTSDLIIVIFSGPEFISGSIAAKILSVKVFVGAINRILAYQVCIPYKKDKQVLFATTSGAIFNLIANSCLIPIFGCSGAAIATLFSECVVFIILTYYAKQLIKTRILYSRLLVYIACSIWFFAVRYLLNGVFSGTLILFLLTVIICVIGYFGILLIIKDEQVVYGLNQVKSKFKSYVH